MASRHHQETFKPVLSRGQQSQNEPLALAPRLRKKARVRTSRTGFGPQRGVSAPATRSGIAQRRVTIKVRVVKLSAYGKGAARLHLHYLDREGTQREEDKQPGFYNRTENGLQRDSITAYHPDEPHQFRLIVSPEDARDLDLTQYTRDFMAQVEHDLNRVLDWKAVNHYNTEHPHTHVIIHGLDQRGDTLYLDREYISHGLRNRAESIATRELGLRVERDISQSLNRQITAMELTATDRQLSAKMHKDHQLYLAPAQDSPASRLQHARYLGRLRQLKEWHLASNGTDEQHWKLEPDFQRELRQMQRDGIAYQRINRAESQLVAGGRQQLIHEGYQSLPQQGLLLTTGLADEHNDTLYAVVADIDSRLHYLETPFSSLSDVRQGQWVRLSTYTPQDTQHNKTKDLRLKFHAVHQLTIDEQTTYPGRTLLDEHHSHYHDSLEKGGVAQTLKAAVQKRAKYLDRRGLALGSSNTLRQLGMQDIQRQIKQYAQRSGKQYKILNPNERLNGQHLATLETPSRHKLHIVANHEHFTLAPDGVLRDHLQQDKQHQYALDRIRPGQDRQRSLSIGRDLNGRYWVRGIERGLSR